MCNRRDIVRTYQNVTRRMKNFLLKFKSKEFFIFLLFFLISAGFWFLQALNNDFEMEFSVPVRLKGIPNQVVMTTEPSGEVRIRVKDKGLVLLNYMLGKGFYPITFNFSDYARRDNRVRIHFSQLEKKILEELKVSTHLLSIKPDTLEYIYVSGASKRVPVKLRGVVSAGKQYYLSDTLFTPDSVEVYAPAGVLDTITAAYTAALNIENISDTLKRQVDLFAPRGVKFIPTSVKMTLPVDIYAEKSIEVLVKGVDFPRDKVLRTFPSQVKVTFQVGMGRFREVDAADFSISISYEELLKLEADKYTVRLDYIPEGVSHVRFYPEQVDFLIEQIATVYGD